MQGDAVLRQVVTFGRILREAGLEVGPGRLADALSGLDETGLARRDDVYWTLRTTLVSRADDLETFDRAFAAWFLGAPVRLEQRRQAEMTRREPRAVPAGTQADGEQPPDAGDDETGGFSFEETLRHKDFAEMTPEELARARKLIAKIATERPMRRSRRLRPAPRGERLDLRRMVRASLATGGDPLERPYRARVERHRKLVLICDVSGSMERYSRALLLFLHAAHGSGRGVETFAFGTRLTRLTPELESRDPEAALDAASARVVDWSGGTRIGASLKHFNDLWGRRALTRGAVVVILSDGWERDDAALVGREMARLARQAFAVVWVNPLKGHPEFQPLAGGMQAALPYIDRFLPGHDVASLEELAAALAGIERRHAA